MKEELLMTVVAWVSLGVAISGWLFSFIGWQFSKKQNIKNQRNQNYFSPMSLRHSWQESKHGLKIETEHGKMSGPVLNLIFYKGFIKTVKAIHQKDGKLVVKVDPLMEVDDLKTIISRFDIEEPEIEVHPFFPNLRTYENKVFSIAYTLYEDLLGNKQIFMHILIYNKKTLKILYYETLDADDLAVQTVSQNVIDKNQRFNATGETPSGERVSLKVETYYSEDEFHLAEFKNEYLLQFEELVKSLKRSVL